MRPAAFSRRAERDPGKSQNEREHDRASDQNLQEGDASARMRGLICLGRDRMVDGQCGRDRGWRLKRVI